MTSENVNFKAENRLRRFLLGTEQKISPKFICPKFFCTPWAHGRPRVRVMDAAPKCPFSKVLGPARGFSPGHPRDVLPKKTSLSLIAAPTL